MPETTELQTTGRGVVAPMSLLQVQDGFNVRFDTTPEDEFLSSVKTHGVLRPLHVRNDPKKPGYYLIVDGERRYRAAKKAKLASVPVIPEGDMGDAEALVMSLVANEGAKHLSAKEEAAAFKRLQEDGVPVPEIARVMGRSERKVEETLRALDSGDDELIAGVTSEAPEDKIPARAAARAATLPPKKRKEVIPKLKGKNAKEGVAAVREAEKEEGISRRGRKARDYPWAKNAKGLAEMIEKAAKKLVKAGGPGYRRSEHHLEVIEVLKGKKEIGDLYVSVLEDNREEAPSAPKKRGRPKKVTAEKKTATKKKPGRPKKTTTKKKVAKKKTAAKKAPKRIQLNRDKAKAA